MSANTESNYVETLKALPDLIKTASTDERSVFVFMIIGSLVLSVLVYNMAMSLFGKTTTRSRLIAFFGSMAFFMFLLAGAAYFFYLLKVAPPTPPVPPTSNGNYDIYGFVKDDRGFPINGVELNIKLNGSNFVQTSGENNGDGFYKFVGIPGIKNQDVTIFPNKEGYMLLDGTDSVKAILGSERPIRLKLKSN
jgi:hypothetical protein